MPVKGLKEVRQQLKGTFGKIKGPMVGKALTEVLITAAGFAATMTPIDTSNLINSQYREINTKGKKVVGAIGYTAAYAAAVHGMSGKLKGLPRKDFGVTRAGESFGGGTGVGNYWDPDAEPGFLRKAFEDPDARAAIDEVMRRHMLI